MRSLRSRITTVTIGLIVIAVTVVSLLSVLYIQNNERLKSEQLLFLLCETGERNLDYYFNSVQKSVEKVATYTEADLEALATEGLSAELLTTHMEHVSAYFDLMAHRTNGVLTYYYRIDPEVSDSVVGFWYTNIDGSEFVAHDVTDITQYNTQDTSKLVWFTVPKHDGTSVWLPPYITDNLNWRVISYNVPIFWKGSFVGVVGIEIDYSVMAEQVESIRLYQNGYAFLIDEKGDLFYHPREDVSELNNAAAPEGLISNSTFLRYTHDGVKKQAAWLGLSNGMRLVVSVPTAETEGDWQKLITQVVVTSLLVLLALSAFTFIYVGRVMKPLEELNNAARQIDQGNFDFILKYRGDDEVGRITSTFGALSNHMKDYISDLNRQVFIDALTSVKNKGAFTSALDTLQTQIDIDPTRVAYAIGVFDCDNLKQINDQYGNEKGDLYLKTACRLICRVFAHSPVFRIGGDEFAVILQHSDYDNREALVKQFEKEKDEICASTDVEWEHVHLTMGITEYDPNQDAYAIDTVRRADALMYTNKRVQRNGAN